jgi:hypothetical protein
VNSYYTLILEADHALVYGAVGQLSFVWRAKRLRVNSPVFKVGGDEMLRKIRLDWLLIIIALALSVW